MISLVIEGTIDAPARARPPLDTWKTPYEEGSSNVKRAGRAGSLQGEGRGEADGPFEKREPGGQEMPAWR